MKAILPRLKRLDNEIPEILPMMTKPPQHHILRSSNMKPLTAYGLEALTEPSMLSDDVSSFSLLSSSNSLML